MSKTYPSCLGDSVLCPEINPYIFRLTAANAWVVYHMDLEGNLIELDDGIQQHYLDYVLQGKFLGDRVLKQLFAQERPTYTFKQRAAEYFKNRPSYSVLRTLNHPMRDVDRDHLYEVPDLSSSHALPEAYSKNRLRESVLDYIQSFPAEVADKPEVVPQVVYDDRELLKGWVYQSLAGPEGASLGGFDRLSLGNVIAQAHADLRHDLDMAVSCYYRMQNDLRRY